MPSRKSQRGTAVELPAAKRPSVTSTEDVIADCLNCWDASESPFTAHRERIESFSSDMSDELEAIDRELEAEEAAAANAITQRQISQSRSNTSSVDNIKDTDVDHVCDQIYEKMEEEAMMEILRDLQHELVPSFSSSSTTRPPTIMPTIRSTTTNNIKPASKSTKAVETACGGRANLLWNIVATPAMMSAFSATVANGGAGAKAE